MDMGNKFSKMEIVMLVNTLMELLTDMDNISGPMEVHTKVTLSME